MGEESSLSPRSNLIPSEQGGYSGAPDWNQTIKKDWNGGLNACVLFIPNTLHIRNICLLCRFTGFSLAYHYPALNGGTV